MDNLENYLYIALALIYIISRVLKARPKPDQNQQPGKPQQARTAGQSRQDRPRKPFSFEDILKEFEKNLGGEEFEEEKPVPVEEMPYSRATSVEEPKKKKISNPYESYEGTTYNSPSISERPKQPEIFTRDENYSFRNDLTSQYIKMLQDPEGFKNAIVLSEIINRKYF